MLTVILIPTGKVFLAALGGKCSEDSRPVFSWVSPVWFSDDFYGSKPGSWLGKSRDTTGVQGLRHIGQGTLPHTKRKAWEEPGYLSSHQYFPC